jgi:hypothetical protein
MSRCAFQKHPSEWRPERDARRVIARGAGSCSGLFRSLQEPASRAIRWRSTTMRRFKTRLKVLITAETFAPLFRGVA